MEEGTEDGWNGIDGYMEAKLRKLKDQFDEDKCRLGKLSNIFDKVSVYVNGYTKPSANKIKEIMAQHGGNYSLYYSRKNTTHIIAQNLAGVKLQNLKPHQKVVQPQWVADCLKANTLLSIQPYLLAVPTSYSGQQLISNLYSDKPSTSKHVVEETKGQIKTSNNLKDSKNIILSTPEKLNHRNKMMSSTTSNSFISEFYSKSRLHFLSKWKSKLSSYVNSLIQEDRRMSGYEKLLEVALTTKNKFQPTDNKYVMHIDMDCFFVSASLSTRPYLKNKPIAVTHCDNSNSDHNQTESRNSWAEIACCSYEARCLGVQNGMLFELNIHRFIPSAIPYDFECYEQISLCLYDIIASYTLEIEAVSCDELLVDLTELISKVGLHPLKISELIRHQIYQETKCHSSAGIGPNITIARLATIKAKPNGQYQVEACQVQDFISQLLVRDLPGVGRKTETKLRDLGVIKCADLQKISLLRLQKEFGDKAGKVLYETCRGLDSRQISQTKERKSISATINYGIRLKDDLEAATFLSNLSEELSSRMKDQKLVGRKLLLKLKIRHPDADVDPKKYGGHGVCNNVTSSKIFFDSTDDAEIFKKTAIDLLKSLKIVPTDLRGIGLQITSLRNSDRNTSISAPCTPKKSKITNFLIRSPVKKRLFHDEKKISHHSTDSQKQTTETGPLRQTTGPLQQTTGPLQQTTGPLQQTTGPLQQTTGPLRQTTGPLQQTTGPLQQTTGPLQQTTGPLQQTTGPLQQTTGLEQRSLDESFLNALPADLREDIEHNIKMQRDQLKKLEKLKSKTARSSFLVAKNKSQKPPSGPCLHTRGRPKGSKNLKRSRKLASDKSLKKNLKITEMYNIIKKPEDTSSQRSDISEEKTFDKVSPRHSPPSLHGSTTLEGVRDAIRSWIKQWSDSYPLDYDVTSVSTFLQQLANEGCNLEMAVGVARSIHRYISRYVITPERCDVDLVAGGDTCYLSVVEEWRRSYQKIVKDLLQAVRSKYGDVDLPIPQF